MTAWNLIVQPQAAYLITDTAVYHRETGAIESFQPKVLELATAIMEPAALAFTGDVLPQEVAPAITRAGIGSASALFEALPDLIRAGERAWQERTGLKRTPECSIAVAAYDHRRGQPYGFVASNDQRMFLGHEYELYTSRYVSFFSVVDLALAFGSNVHLCDPERFDPLTDALKLLEQQRREPVDGNSVVGGHGLVTIVGANGVRTVGVCEWQDEVGERVAA